MQIERTADGLIKRSHFEIDAQGRVFVFLAYGRGDKLEETHFQVPRRQFEQVLAGKRPIERLKAIG